MTSKISRRLVLTAIAAIMVAMAPHSAFAQKMKYPVPTVHFIHSSSAGSTPDLVLREMARHLGTLIETNFVVESVRGASGATAMAKVGGAPADGSYFFFMTPGHINLSMLTKLQVSYSDLDPVVGIFDDPMNLYTRTENPNKDLKSIVDAAKKGGVWGTGAPGSFERLTLERFKRIADVNPTIVTHDGGAAQLVAVLNGSVEIGTGEIPELQGQIEAGKVRMLATFSPKRLASVPNMPTVREAGIDFAAQRFRGLVAPKGTPKAVVQIWEQATPKLLAVAEFKDWYEKNSLTAQFMSQSEFAKTIETQARELDVTLKEMGLIK